MIRWMALGFLISLAGCTAAGNGQNGFSTEGSGGTTGAVAGSSNPGTGGTGGISFTTVGSGNAVGSGSGGSSCGNTLLAKIRDFTDLHPDFEHFPGGQLDGIVTNTLGPDGKPVYAHPGPTPQTTGPAEFAHWYNDTPNVNMWETVQIQFLETSPGVFLYDNPMFFPIDGKGFGNGPGWFPLHNFLFTTEIHSTFTYNGGEVFTFRGDDDLWVFINSRLAIDLGGLHSAMEETANIDALAPTLGITPGNTYPLDVFHAERHTNESNFRIETTIDCFVPVPPPQ